MMVSVIVPSYHDWQRLELCVALLRQQTYPAHLFEVILVNNDPNDRPPENFKTGDNVHLVSEARPGSYAARNRGLQMARGEVIAFTDSDCQPEPDWIANAVEVFRSRQCDRIAGDIKIIPSPQNPSYITAYEDLFSFNQEAYAGKGVSTTANLFVKKEVFEKSGTFREVFSGEDLEWNMRATEGGSSIVFGDNVLVKHPARTRQEIITKTRRLYPRYYRTQCPETPFRHIIWPFIVLRPPLNFIKRLLTGYHPIPAGTKVRLVLFVYRLRLVQLTEHFRLLFGGKMTRV